MKEITFNRRDALVGLLTAAGVAGSSPALLAQTNTTNCTLTPNLEQGAQWVETTLNRSNITTDPFDTSIVAGVPLTLVLNVSSITTTGCSPLSGARVDVWQADALGHFSNLTSEGTTGREFLRGYQMTDANGQVRFTTIVPGWTPGRAPRIHVRVRTQSGQTFTGTYSTQLFFNDSQIDTIYQQLPYFTHGNRDTMNSNDPVLRTVPNAAGVTLNLTPTDGGYTATANIGVNLQGGAVGASTIYSLPQLAFGGGWYTALYLANTNNTPADVSVNFVNTQGSALRVDLGGNMGTNSTFNMTLPPHSTQLIELPGNQGQGQGQGQGQNSTLSEGWIEATLPQGVVGYAVFRQSVNGRANQEAVVPLAPQTSNRAVMVFEDVGFTTGLAIVNPGNSVNTVTFTAYNTNGQQIGTGTLNIPARGRTSVSLRTIPGLAGIGGMRGWLMINATSNISVMGLRFGQEAFTSIPATYLTQ